MKIIKIGWGAFYYVNFWHEEYSVLDFTNEGFHEIEFHSKRGKQKIEVNFDIDFAPDYALAVQVRKVLIFNCKFNPRATNKKLLVMAAVCIQIDANFSTPYFVIFQIFKNTKFCSRNDHNFSQKINQGWSKKLIR